MNPSLPSTPPPPRRVMEGVSPNVVVIMLVLVFVLVCAVFFTSLMRYVLLRRARAQNARAVFLHNDRVEEDNSSEHGLDAKTLASLPVLTFKAGETSKPREVDCTICLSEFTENDTLRLLSKCNHVFHVDCIDMWLLSHISCPVCRNPIKDSEPPTTSVDQAAQAGGTIFLTRDHQGNASARISIGGEIIVGEIGKGENLDVRGELMRGTSWNSLSAARLNRSRRITSREGSMDYRLGSSHRSFRAEIAAIMASDKAVSARWQASSSSFTGAAPAASSGRPSAEGSGLAAKGHLRAPSSSPSEHLIEMT